MPPAAKFLEFTTLVEDTIDGIADVGGIEVEALYGRNGRPASTRITMIARNPLYEEGRREGGLWGDNSLPSQQVGDFDKQATRHSGLSPDSIEKCLADSFDSADEMTESSTKARLIKRREEGMNSGLEGPLTNDGVKSRDRKSLGEDEAKYLDVLDKHLEETDPNSTTFSDLENGPDELHPKKNQPPDVGEMIENFLDAPCCECTTGRPLKSALRPSRWTLSDSSAPVESNPDLTRPRSVQFKDVNIREFQMTLGNHPSASSGPPVMLDWDTRPDPKVMELETYERARQPRRSRRQLRLSLQQRHVILYKDRGFSFEEVKEAWEESLEVRKQRRETLDRGLALSTWDEVWESTCRKFNRMVEV